MNDPKIPGKCMVVSCPSYRLQDSKYCEDHRRMTEDLRIGTIYNQEPKKESDTIQVPIPARTGYMYRIIPVEGGLIIETWAQSGFDQQAGMPIYKFVKYHVQPADNIRIIDREQEGKEGGK